MENEEKITKQQEEVAIELLEKQVNKKIFKWYIIFGIVFFLVVAVSVIFFLLRIRILYLILWIILAIPIFLGSIIVILIRLYIDRNKIKSFVWKRLSKNVVIIEIFTKNKKKKRFALRITGTEFIWKGGLYLIDEKAVWFDKNNYPTLHYFEGIPNPLLFNFEYYLMKYNNAKDKTSVKDEQSNIIDVSYSSTTLQQFKKDKLFSELHKSSIENITPLLMILGIVVVIVLLVVMMMGKK